MTMAHDTALIENAAGRGLSDPAGFAASRARREANYFFFGSLPSMSPERAAMNAS